MTRHASIMNPFRFTGAVVALSLLSGCTSSGPEVLDPAARTFPARHTGEKQTLPTTPEEAALWLTKQSHAGTGFSILNIGVENQVIAVDARCTSKPYTDEKNRLVVDAEITEASIRRYGYLFGHSSSHSGYEKRTVRVIIHQ
jgi:hypothetical protein